MHVFALLLKVWLSKAIKPYKNQLKTTDTSDVNAMQDGAELRTELKIKK